jgi:hypothetical protein
MPKAEAEVWLMDLVSGFPEVAGKTAFMTFVDPFTNFKVAVPCSTKISAVEVTNMIESHIIQIFGVPRRLESDNGPNLLAADSTKKWLAAHDIQYQLHLPHHPTGHALVERSNRSISDLLTILQKAYAPITWVRLLALTVLSLNSTASKLYNDMSPMELMFKRPYKFNIPETLIDSETRKGLTKFQDLVKKIDSRVALYVARNDKARIAANKKKGGVFVPYPPGTAIYHKDTRRGLEKKKPKLAQVFRLTPLLVLEDYPFHVKARDFWGVEYKLHKNLIRPCSEREYETFDRLPAKIKAILGYPFTAEEIVKAHEDGRVPAFWEAVAKLEGRSEAGEHQTRSKGVSALDNPGVPLVLAGDSLPAILQANFDEANEMDEDWAAEEEELTGISGLFSEAETEPRTRGLSKGRQPFHAMLPSIQEDIEPGTSTEPRTRGLSKGRQLCHAMLPPIQEDTEPGTSTEQSRPSTPNSGGMSSGSVKRRTRRGREVKSPVRLNV